VFGVRPGLIVDVQNCQDTEVAHRYGLKAPFKEVVFDFSLVKQTAPA
jgi:hypothetical protein